MWEAIGHGRLETLPTSQEDLDIIFSASRGIEREENRMGFQIENGVLMK